MYLIMKVKAAAMPPTSQRQTEEDPGDLGHPQPLSACTIKGVDSDNFHQEI